MRVALLSIDGVGVRVAAPAVNPLARGRWLLSRFQDGRRPPGAPVLVVSDHGNVEDLTTRNHTRHDLALPASGVPPAHLHVKVSE